MTITLTWQSIAAIVAGIGVLIALYKYLRKTISYAEKPIDNEQAISDLRKHHDDDIADIKEEQAVNTRGILAALRGLQEMGCDGPVKEGIADIEKYLNKKAHDIE